MEAVVHSKSQKMKKVGPNLYRGARGRYYLPVKRAGKQFRWSVKTRGKTAKINRRSISRANGGHAGPREERK